MFALRRAVQRPVATTLQNVRYSHQSPHGHSGDPKEVEKEKQKNLKGHSDSPVEGAPGWNEKLASDAEIKVKATKDKRSPKEMQEDTAAQHQKEQKQ